MNNPQIAKIKPGRAPHTLNVTWRGGGADAVDLSGLVFRHEVFAPLRAEAAFRDVAVINNGDAIAWDATTPDGERLDYGADTLYVLAEEQRPMSGAAMADFRAGHGLSQSDLAGILGVTTRTVQNHEAAEQVPASVGITVRALGRNRTVLDAHLGRPGGKPGRPRKEA